MGQFKGRVARCFQLMVSIFSMKQKIVSFAEREKGTCVVEG